ncbi:MAG: anaerobic ribonucleoside-triphosphate reductase activating protein [Candidatus Njordarchaeum guaymaensis]
MESEEEHDIGKIKVKVSGWKDLSLVDVIGEPSFTVWFNYCNFACPWCQNWLVVSGKKMTEILLMDLFKIIKQSELLVNYLHVTGGEPTLQGDALQELFNLVKKNSSLRTSLNTNGSNFRIIKNLIRRGLLDHIAMDIKAPLERPALYAKVIGLPKETTETFVRNIQDSVVMALNELSFVELRTTVVPGLLKGEDVLKIVEELIDMGINDRPGAYYVIQQFVPPNIAPDPAFKELPRTPPETLIKLARSIKNRTGIKNILVRSMEEGVTII